MASGNGGLGRLSPVDAMSELARIAVSEYETGTAAARIVGLARRAVPGAVEVSMTQLRDDRALTVASTGPLARELDERQYASGQGPSVSTATAGELSDVPDTAADSRWPDYAVTAAALGVRSSLSVPVPVREPASAALNLYGTAPRAFSADSRELATAFAAYAGVALISVQLHDDAATLARQLEEAMRSRAEIDQAKGILMAQRGCSAEEAFHVLVELSQRTNRKLRDLARDLVAQTVKGGLPGTSSSPTVRRG